LELLSGVPAGERREDGTYPPDTINGRTMARLQHITERLRETSPFGPDFAGRAGTGDSGHEGDQP
jgi:hypothetical protein